MNFKYMLLVLEVLYASPVLHRHHRDLIGYNRLLNNIRHWYSGRNRQHNPQLDYVYQMLQSDNVSVKTKLELAKFFYKDY